MTETMSDLPELQLAYEPALLPPIELMAREGITVLEEWYRWAEEWSVLLRVFGNLRRDSNVLEIGCGLGRIAFALRYVVTAGSYSGFDICRYKIQFLQERFEPAHSRFFFTHADVNNTEYNPEGKIPADQFVFPYRDANFDLIYAASVFTHMLPKNVERYFRQASRVLRPGGCCLFSFFLLDHYQPSHLRPAAFARPVFDFPHSPEDYGTDFAAGDPQNLELMTAFRLSLLERFAAEAGLKIEKSWPGFWSGSFPNWAGGQDLLLLRKPA